MGIMFSVIVLLLSAGQLFAQPEVDRLYLYDNNRSGGDLFADIYPAANGDFLVCGQNGGLSWLKRIANDGQTIWDFRLNNGGRLFSVIEADNGDILTGGTIGQAMFGILRISSDGNLIWRHEYISGRATAIIEMKEGDYFACGSARAGSSHGYITRFQSNGQPVWGNTYNAALIFQTMRETDGGVVVAGFDGSSGFIQKVDLMGNRIWSRSHMGRGRSMETYSSMVSTPDGFALAVTGSVNNRMYSGILKINAAGQVTSDTLYNAAEGVYSEGIGKTAGNGLVLVGQKTMNGYHYPFGIRISGNGSPVWTLDFADVVEQLPQDALNSLYSVIVLPEDVIIAAGTMYNPQDNRRLDDALVVRLAPEILAPILLYKLPEDSIQTLLTGATLQFTVGSRDARDRALNYEWFYSDSILQQHDTTVTIRFDTLAGDYPINCRVWNGDGEIQTGWLVQVRNFFIYSSSPDTLSLALRRGTTQTFSLDSVAAVEGDPVQYAWTLTNIDNFEREDAGMETSATVEFLQSGNYQMEGLAYRGESSDNVVWTIQVRSAILDFWPRELSLSVFADSLVNFGVLPFNPASDSLSYRWEVDGDSVGSDSTVGLRFAWNGQAGRSTYAVAAIVMDGAEGDTVKWEVTVLDPNATPPTPPSIEGGEVPTTFGIASVSPNPFNSTTTIRFTVPSLSSSSTSAQSASSAVTRRGQACEVHLTLHDLTGREVRECVSAEMRAGEHSVIVDGGELPAGVYLLRLDAGGNQAVRKVVLLR